MNIGVRVARGTAMVRGTRRREEQDASRNSMAQEIDSLWDGDSARDAESGLRDGDGSARDGDSGARAGTVAQGTGMAT